MSFFPRNGVNRPLQPTNSQDRSNNHDRSNSQSQPNNQDRSNLTRRFTTDAGHVPTLSNMLNSPQRGVDNTQEFHIEQKKAEYERIREQRKRFEIEMARLEQQQHREAAELAQMEEDLGRYGPQGHQSEPTTPPEHHHSGFPSMFSRPSRYSMSSLASPPGFITRPNRSGSQLTSPPSNVAGGRFGFDEITFRSVPVTRRNSDDREKDNAVRQDPTSYRSTNAINRYSMPVTRTRTGPYEHALDGTNTTRFLFGDDDFQHATQGSAIDDGFPTLVRQNDQMLSASSAALDLAQSSSPNPEAPTSNNWAAHINRHRTQQSLSSINNLPSGDRIGLGSNRHNALRQSVDLRKISENTQGNASGINPSPGNTSSNMPTPPRLQSSFSANEVPTVQSPSTASNLANNHAQQHFHNHNASIGRIPAGAVASRHTRELSSDGSGNMNRDQANNFPSIQSTLHANATPFGPSTTNNSHASTANVPTSAGPSSMNSNISGYYQQNGYIAPNGANAPPNYGPGTLTGGMQQMNLNGPNSNNMYPPQNYNAGYGPAQTYSGNGNANNHSRDSQARVIQNRRQIDSEGEDSKFGIHETRFADTTEAMARYHNMPMETFKGQIYDLCKDQHGCRYLQKKLEERNQEHIHMIWTETHQHVTELMTDPFGNYLCQKLLEFCGDDDRTALIQNASKDMVRIALNQHGTRALQKMIEFVTLPLQINIIIDALRHRVVNLIQDLNGNHVIQKCLNKLSPTDAQFIFDAVGDHVIDVGTHRHGCCVLQRCIDHASGNQKLRLIEKITDQARILVQDPFGNYVVQYIIDLNDPTFTEPLVKMFEGAIGTFSRHKFSSNVIEKCLRCAKDPSKDLIVEEMLKPQEIERLIRDSYANYVVQTALDYATPHNKHYLVEAIRPLLPQIRSTPYGRRIQHKIAQYDNRGIAAASGQITPADNTQGQIPLRNSNHSRGPSNSSTALSPTGSVNANPVGIVPGIQNGQPPMQPYAGNGNGNGDGNYHGAPASGSRTFQQQSHQNQQHPPRYN